MGVSRMTCAMIQGNETTIIETPDRLELWTTKDGNPHALMLSCPLDKRKDLEDTVAYIKSMEY